MGKSKTDASEPASGLPVPAALSFEQAMAELEKIVEEMERRDIPLDETIARYERGVQLSIRCKQCLDQAQEKILKLMGDGTTEPLEDKGGAGVGPGGGGGESGGSEADATLAPAKGKSGKDEDPF